MEKREELAEKKAELELKNELQLAKWAYTYEEWCELLKKKQILRKEIAELEKYLSEN